MPSVRPTFLQRARRAAGFTLIELMLVVAIVAVLLGIALPSYNAQVVRTRRAAASGCVLEYAQFMERVYAANLRYDTNAGVATSLPATACSNDMTAHYSFAFATAQPQQRTFKVNAVPLGIQATRDTKCATLSIDQANVKGKTGTGTVADCWK